ncbi:MAG: transposase [Anaerostipes sp.]|nr:transposase [Anaerostipes sp.]
MTKGQDITRKNDISDIEDQVLSMYPTVLLDAIHLNVGKDRSVVKKTVYVAIGIKLNGKKDVLGM